MAETVVSLPSASLAVKVLGACDSAGGGGIGARLAAKRPASLKLEPLLKSAPAPPQFPSHRTVNLSFQDLSYSVKTGIKRESKCILKRISGEFQSGELTAIMGPSGAGKSTLMDILAGYTTYGVTGSVRVNGVERDVRRFRRQSSYIMQDDKLQPLLTVQEAMAIAANLKLGPQFSPKHKQERVDQILLALGLSEVEKTKTGSLSGGQRKRLAIALELVNNPPVMFFDEPTSGLDSCTSRQCLTVLKLLAREGRTVVCTIHQPSASQFEMFDHLYVVAEGNCIYQGSIKGMVPYLSEVGLECPSYHNPADFVLEISTGDYGDHNGALVEAIQNGKCNDWRRRQTERSSFSHVGALPSGLVTPVHAPCIPPTPASVYGTRPPDYESKYDDAAESCIGDHPTSLLSQFLCLLRRTFLLILRDKFLTIARLTIHLVVGVLIGLIYYKVGNDAAHVFHNFGLLYFCIMFLMFTAFSSMMLTFPSEIPIISREYFNRWYSLKCYYLAITLADVPLQVVCSIGYTLVVYLMTEQPSEMLRYFLFLTVCVLVAMVAQSIGLLIGASMSIQNGMVWGALAIMPFTIFSGFFVHMNDAPAYFQWLFHISYLKYGLDGVLISVYSYERKGLSCSIDYCHYTSPKKFLEALDMGHGSYWFNILILTIMFFSLRLLCYFILLYRLKNRR
ncbi:ATP-binding cassette sub-family G member 4-like [Periplaneta americana]|uniref:ATP-binding cassette sub-family G member 4-like n=1 Tax=Periplaneta americana TaxID=6978 RepID=UPI0037E79A71